MTTATAPTPTDAGPTHPEDGPRVACRGRLVRPSPVDRSTVRPPTHPFRTLAATVASALAAVAPAACSTGGPATVDAGRVETEISTALTAEVGFPPDEVSCPDDLEAEPGATTRCEVTVDGASLGARVEVTSVEGDVAEFDIQVDEEPTG